MLQGSALIPSFDIALDNIPGVSAMQSGYLSSSATSIQAIRGSAYTEQTTPSNLEVVSSSASDASAGTGTRTLLVTYYRADGSGPFAATVTMNGTTAVAIGDGNAQFVEKMESVTIGSNGTNVGTITIRRNGGGAVVGTIVAGDGRTFWAHHYVALGKTCFIKALNVSSTTTALTSVGVSVFLRKIAMLTASAFEEQITTRYRSFSGVNGVQFIFENLWVAGPARITTYVQPDNATAGTIWADLDFYEV